MDNNTGSGMGFASIIISDYDYSINCCRIRKKWKLIRALAAEGKYTTSFNEIIRERN